MEIIHHIQGRDLREQELTQVCDLIASHPDWSRWRISAELARMWQWRSATGQLKDMAARSLLNKLESRGWIALPPRRSVCRQLPLPLEAPLSVSTPPPPPLAAKLCELTPLSVTMIVAGQPDHRSFSRYLAEYHYLGYRGPVGENLGYLIRDRQGRDLSCVLFGAAAWQAQARDHYIGWDSAARKRNLSLLTNNTRFLILPWVRVDHLASHILGLILRRLVADWQSKYGHPLMMVETFVQRDRFRGTCYRAANWTFVGHTQGRSRQDRRHEIRVPVKDIYVYSLCQGFRDRLKR